MHGAREGIREALENGAYELCFRPRHGLAVFGECLGDAPGHVARLQEARVVHIEHRHGRCDRRGLGEERREVDRLA